jgi:hypothetical protein
LAERLAEAWRDEMAWIQEWARGLTAAAWDRWAGEIPPPMRVTMLPVTPT